LAILAGQNIILDTQHFFLSASRQPKRHFRYTTKFSSALRASQNVISGTQQNFLQRFAPAKTSF